MGYYGVVHVLVEEGRGAEDVEGDAVGDFDEVELFFFWQDGVDVWFEARVGFEDFGADGALGGGLDLFVRSVRNGLDIMLLREVWTHLGLGLGV